MTNPASPTFSVLFVDDDGAFLELVEESFGGLSGGAWEILTAKDAAATSITLKQQKVDLLVLDVRMPDISGLQLITLLQEDYPDLPKVFLAGVVGEADRVAAMESGAALFFEKPTDAAGLRGIYTTLNELLKWREKRGTATVPRATLLDLVKLECSAKNSRVFEVFTTEKVEGKIYIKDGDIVHAESPGRRGQSAFTYLTTLLDAEFSLEQFGETPERSILRQWEFLYLEAVQLRVQLAEAAEEAKAQAEEATAEEGEVSEGAGAEAQAASAEKVSSSAVPKAKQKQSDDRESLGVLPPVSVTDEEATRALFKRPASARDTSASVTARSAPSEAGDEVEAVPAAEPVRPLRMLRPEVPSAEVAAPKSPAKAIPSSDARAKAVASGPRIQELLVCSYSADVLYDWQCPQADRRLRFVETARDRSERLSTHLPLGPVDRLELQAAKGRLVLRFQEDGAVLMRSGTSLAPTAAGSVQRQSSIEGWLAGHAGIRGLLAAGVLRAPDAAVSQLVHKDYVREALGVVWQCVQEILDKAPEQGIEPWQLRWVFDQAQLYVARREDGKALGTFLAKDPAEVDTAAVEGMFKEFKALKAS